MAALPLIATIASTAFSVIGAMQQGSAAEANAKSQEYASKYNAQVNDNKARAINQQWSAREDVLRRNRRMALGENRASSAQSGLTDTGSILDLFDQSAIDSEFDILNSRYEGQTQAQGFNEAATLNRYEAKVAKQNASSARTSGFLNSGSALLSGAATGYGQYQTYKANKKPAGSTMKSEGLIK